MRNGNGKNIRQDEEYHIQDDDDEIRVVETKTIRQQKVWKDESMVQKEMQVVDTYTLLNMNIIGNGIFSKRGLNDVELIFQKQENIMITMQIS